VASSKRLFAGRLFAGRLFAPALIRGTGESFAVPTRDKNFHLTVTTQVALSLAVETDLTIPLEFKTDHAFHLNLN